MAWISGLPWNSSSGTKKGIEQMEGYEEVSQELLQCAAAVINMDTELQSIKNKIGKFHDI